MLRLALKQVRHNPKRLILTALAVALGVSLVTASMSFTNALQSGFDKLFRDIYSTQSIVVEADPDKSDQTDPFSLGKGIFTDEDVANVAAVEGVEHAVGSIQVQAIVAPQGVEDPFAGASGAPQQIFGWGDDDETGTVTILEGRAPESNGEIIVDVDGLAGLGYEIGDTLTMYSELGAEQFTVVGTMRFGEDNNLQGAALMFITMEDAHRIADDPGFASIAVYTAEGADNDAIATAIQEVVPENTRAITSEQKIAEQVEVMGEIMRMADIIAITFALISLFVGAYLIVNTFRVIVSQRTREIGLLRAIGVTGKQIRTMILLEALAIAILATTLGIGLGYLLALTVKLLMTLVGAGTIGALTLPWDAVVLSYVLGSIVTVTAALTPAIHASRISPMEALRESATGGKKPLGRRNLVGAILAVVGIASVTVGLYASPWDPWILVAIGAVLLILGVTLLAAQLIAPVAQGLRGLLTSWFRVDGKLAANNIRREPRRSANTAAALMIGVMLLALISTFTESLKTTVASEFEQAAADLYMVGAQGNIPQGAIDMVAARDDVESLARMGIAAGRIDGETLMISVIDSVPADGVYPIDVEPALSQMGEGVYVNPALAAQGYSVGDTITIEGAEGTLDLVVTGNYLTEGDPTVIIDFATAEQLGDIDVVQTMVVLTEGTDVKEAVEAITEDLKSEFPLVMVMEPSAIVQLISMLIDLILVVINSLLAGALFIAILGVANTLLLSVTERTREIGLLRAVGMKKAQVWRMITTESLVMALFGTVLGMVLGVGLGSALVLALEDFGLGTVTVPWLWLIVYTVLAVIAGVLAAIWPAWRASRMDILQAIAADG